MLKGLDISMIDMVHQKTIRLLVLLGLIFFPPVLFFLLESFFQLNYLLSSSYKIVFFAPIFYRHFFSGVSYKQALRKHFSGRVFLAHWPIMLGIGLLLAAIYFGAYELAKGYIDFQTIVAQLDARVQIDVQNILMIGLYIVFFNSLLEEYFWRGFLFDEMRGLVRPWLAYGLTGLAFSFHHVMFYYDWFNLPLFLLVSGGLIAYSLIMNVIFQQVRDLFSCWLVHAMADVVQVMIALVMFGFFR